jgi:hypothetical protein
MEINNFYEELESSSQCSSIDTFESIDLNNNNNFYNIYRIKHNRSRTRIHNCDKFGGALAFDIIWETGEETKEPLQNLINRSEQKVNTFILEILNDYITTARKYPHRKRSCIMCKKRVYNGAFMCKKHTKQYSFLN